MTKYNLVEKFYMGMQCYNFESERYIAYIDVYENSTNKNFIHGKVKPKEGINGLEFDWYINGSVSNDIQLSWVDENDIDSRITQLLILKEEMKALTLAIQEHIPEYIKN